MDDRKDNEEPHDEMVNKADLLDREIWEYPASHHFPEKPDVALRQEGTTGEYGNKVVQNRTRYVISASAELKKPVARLTVSLGQDVAAGRESHGCCPSVLARLKPCRP